MKIEPTETTGLDTTSYVQCELLRSINRRRLIHQLGTIDTATSHQISDIVKTLLNH